MTLTRRSIWPLRSPTSSNSRPLLSRSGLPPAATADLCSRGISIYPHICLYKILRYIYTYMCVCVCVCMYISIFKYSIYIYIFIYIYIYICRVTLTRRSICPPGDTEIFFSPLTPARHDNCLQCSIKMFWTASKYVTYPFCFINTSGVMLTII